MPPLTEERRKQLVKTCNSAGEEAKISIRNARREAIDGLKKELKTDFQKMHKRRRRRSTKIHDEYIKSGRSFGYKEKEIMTV